MITGKTLVLSTEAWETLRTAVVDGDLLRLPGPATSKEQYHEIKRALEALGWRWDRPARAFRKMPDPVQALREAVETGEVPL